MKKTIIIICSLFISTIITAQDIATVRNQPLGSIVTVTGIVTNGDELGSIRYIEDGTSGIALYDLSSNNYLSGLLRGDSISITGELADYNGLLEVYVSGSATFYSSNNSLPAPQLITPIQIGEDTESELIQIDNVLFNNGGSLFTVGTHDFVSNGETSKIYVRVGSPLENTMIPMGAVTLIGISTQYIAPQNPSIPDSYQILARDSADIIPSGGILFTSPVIQSNITTTSFDLTWSTSNTSSSNCDYGTSSVFTNSINNGGSNTTHTISITNLSPATIYYVKCYSVSGVDTAYSSTGVYSTASNSSGIIKTYFNKSVDNTFSTGVNALNITTSFNDTIKAYIDRAQNTLDICVYNASDATIASAINDAYNRGVSVRYIADDGTANLMLSSLDPNIPIVYRDPAPAGLMHNKFVVIDVESTNTSWIMTGSTNWTNPSNLFNDYNNLIFIQDQALAKAYTLEFEEMWGGVFGHNKEDNTPHNFLIGGSEVELYFSPSDQPTSKINKALESANHSIAFALLSFTRNDLAQTIIDKNSQFGIGARGIIEQENGTGSQYADLLSNGVSMRSHAGIPHQIHHKYAIVDANFANSDPLVITGSHNWSNNAENNSDENTLIIHDPIITNIYLQEFEKRWCELQIGGCVTSDRFEFLDSEIIISPNPSRGKINIDTELFIEEIYLYSVEGRLIDRFINTDIFIDQKGIFFIKVVTVKGEYIKKIVVE